MAWLDAQIYALPHVDLTPNLGNDTSVCFGNEVILNAGDFDKYNWSNSYTNSLSLVSQNGNYTVTVSDKFNCSGTVATIPLPDATIQATTPVAAAIQFSLMILQELHRFGILVMAIAALLSIFCTITFPGLDIFLLHTLLQTPTDVLPTIQLPFTFIM